MPRQADPKKMRRTRPAATALGVALVAGLLAANGPSEHPVQTPAVLAPTPETLAEVFRGGEAGFVVTEIAYALGPDAKDSGACPAGMTRGIRDAIEAYRTSPAGARNEGETDQAYQRRMLVGAHTAPNGQNICMNPEAGIADPKWRMVSGLNPRIDGIDLDGQDSAPGRRPAAGTCGHQDFQGANGQRGIDNQFYRAVGCMAGFQSTGVANGWRTEMYTGAWGILVTLKGVDDPRNDPDVQVGIYANADPIQLSAARDALPFATYAVDQDPRFRSTTRGRIVNGVLTIDPVDVRIHSVTNAMYDERVLRDARLRLTFTANGGMEGFLAGYSPIDAMYDQQFGSRKMRTAKGELAAVQRRVQVAQGREDAFGYTCNGAYYALKQAADGHPDANGNCTSISTQYRIRIAPAFVVDAKTQSLNAPLAIQ